jgi:DNA modification methylase
VVYRPIEWFKPYERNPRKNDQAVDRMVASIAEFGFTVPMLVRSSGEVIDGHLRLKAAVKSKQFAELPAIFCDGWSEAQVKAFRLMVNRSVNWADWDLDALSIEFGELKALEFNLSLTGFDSREIDQFTLVPNAAEDEVPPVPVDPVTRAGDLWLLGGHRLLCGDSTSEADVQRVMGDERAGLMNTDPPYGISYDSAQLHEHGVSYAKISGDHHEDEALQAFLEKAFRAALIVLKPDAAWYLWHAMLTQGFFAAAAAAAAAHVILHRQIIWVKPVLVFGRGQYHWKHELCFMGWVKGHEPVNLTGHTDTTVWDVSGVSMADRKDFAHSTPKPVELFRRPILKHLRRREIAYEPFAGSGPQFIAAEATERRCYGLEINPAYCDVIVARWEKLTGKKATLDGHAGLTFEQVKFGRQLERQDAIKEETEEAAV